MAVYPKTFVPNNFIEQSDGRFKATIFATTHNLGTDFQVEKMLRLKDNGDWENMIASYKILANGDFEYFVDEQCVCKVYLVGDS